MKKQAKKLVRKIVDRLSTELAQERDEAVRRATILSQTILDLNHELEVLRSQCEETRVECDGLIKQVDTITSRNIDLEQQMIILTTTTPTQEPAKKRISRKKVETEA